MAASTFPFEPVPSRDSSGNPMLESDEELAGTFQNITLVLSPAADQGVGTLYITTRRVIWLDIADNDKGYALRFPKITMHAIAKDQQSFDKPCIYAQLEPSTSTDGYPDEEEEEEEQTPEMWLCPGEPSTLTSIFEVMCDCAAKNPDPGMEDNDDEGEFFYDEDEVMAGAGADGRAALSEQYDALLQMPSPGDLDELLADDPERFEDADEDDHDEDMQQQQ